MAETIRALDAFSQAVHCPPVLANDAEDWGGISVCEWDLPWLDGFELAENDDFIIAYHSAGSRSVRASCDGAWIDKFSIPGLISVIPPGRRIDYRIQGAVCFSSVHIPRRMVSPVWGEQGLAQRGIRFAFQDAYTQACMETLVDEARHARSRSLPYVQAVTRALLLHLVRNFEREDGALAALGAPSAASTARADLGPVLDFIDAHLAWSLNLDDLAERAGTSRAHFARQFREAVGIAPHRYVTLRRVERAKELLQQSSTGLAEMRMTWASAASRTSPRSSMRWRAKRPSSTDSCTNSYSHNAHRPPAQQARDSSRPRPP
jgi:AraC family transcriptional regulator